MHYYALTICVLKQPKHSSNAVNGHWSISLSPWGPIIVRLVVMFGIGFSCSLEEDNGNLKNGTVQVSETLAEALYFTCIHN